jgi:hypothetical protein
VPLVAPVVTKLTSGGTDMADYLSALFTHFGSSSKFSIKTTSPVGDAFVLEPIDVDETWEMSFRLRNTTATYCSIEPTGSITDPGLSGDPGTAPSTLSAENSTEIASLTVTGAESSDFYVIELDDAFFVLFMNSGETFTPLGIHAGRIYIPYYSDGVDGDNFADGLGLLGGAPYMDGAFSANRWFSSHTTSISRTRGDQTNWYRNQGAGSVPSSRIQEQVRLRPVYVQLSDTQGTTDNRVGYAKYCMYTKTAQSPGAVLDSGSDAWCHIYPTLTSGNQIIPWDKLVTPAF